MTATAKATQRKAAEPDCSVERTLLVLSGKGGFLIVREALMADVERFAGFQNALGVAPNILTARLDRLIEAGVTVKRSYREPGSRTRQSNRLTAAGRNFEIPLAAP